MEGGDEVKRHASVHHVAVLALVHAAVAGADVVQERYFFRRAACWLIEPRVGLWGGHAEVRKNSRNNTKEIQSIPGSLPCCWWVLPPSSAPLIARSYRSVAEALLSA